MPRYESMVISKSEVQQKKKFARQRIIGLLIALAFFTSIGFLIHYTQSLHLFTLQHVKYVGQQRVNTSEVTRLLGLRNGINLFDLNLKSLESKIDKMTWVKKARVHRSLPDNLVIEIEEYHPTAVLLKDHAYLVSEEGHLLPPAPTGYVINLPVITNYKGILPQFGKKLTDQKCVETIAILAEMRKFKMYDRMSEVRFTSSTTNQYFIDEGRIEILLSKKHRESISAIDNFLKTIPGGVNMNNVAYIDARSPGFIALNEQAYQTVLLGSNATDKKKNGNQI